jgi:hypothetical protein
MQELACKAKAKDLALKDKAKDFKTVLKDSSRQTTLPYNNTIPYMAGWAGPGLNLGAPKRGLALNILAANGPGRAQLTTGRAEPGRVMVFRPVQGSNLEPRIIAMRLSVHTASNIHLLPVLPQG